MPHHWYFGAITIRTWAYLLLATILSLPLLSYQTSRVAIICNDSPSLETLAQAR
ncbi:hypothetical protein BDV24DRAFT_29534 [Aspergillus arachidicola]|uniref:Uncharacterized protein n=1 Tax=Aspergillus arachidicola TaxID=656916 RepID=A0A5N6YFS2_9EURO|nr:hypothetical protein BDV24DRAFT_29534 [Aspergillus arachidicola]